MLEQVTIERIDGGIVDVRGEHTLAEVVQDNGSDTTAQSPEGFLMEFRPGLRTGTEDQKAYGFAAVAEGEDEQS